MSERIYDLRVFRDDDIEEIEAFSVEEERETVNPDVIQLWEPLVRSEKTLAAPARARIHPYIMAIGIILWVITHKRQ